VKAIELRYPLMLIKDVKVFVADPGEEFWIIFSFYPFHIPSFEVMRCLSLELHLHCAIFDCVLEQRNRIAEENATKSRGVNTLL
jgi:hypothetical protein